MNKVEDYKKLLKCTNGTLVVDAGRYLDKVKHQ